MSAPACNNASTKCWIGRSFMRGSPVNITSFCGEAPSRAKQSAAANGRMAVPALPKNNAKPSCHWKAPPKPCTSQTDLSSDSEYCTPRCFKALSIWRISSLSNKFVTLVEPRANAANNKARLERLFEPGRLIVPSTWWIGLRVMEVACCISCPL